LFPETFGSKYTYAASKKRFELSPVEEEIRERDWIRRALDRTPRLLFFLRKVRGRLRMKPASKENENETYSNIEALLLAKGLEKQANVLRANRIAQSSFARENAKTMTQKRDENT